MYHSIATLLVSLILVSGLFKVSESASVARGLLDIKEIIDIEKEVSNHRLLHHDLLLCLQNGGFKNTTEAVKTFFSHHYVYSHRFIDYLNKVLSKVDNETVRHPIEENINEENGNYEESDMTIMEKHGIQRDWFQKIPHKVLSKRFLESVGVNSEELKNMDANSEQARNHAGFQFTNYMLNMYDKTNPCEAVAVIGFAIEETVSKLYSFIYDTLANHTSLHASQYVFFPLHILIDDGHADLLKLAYKNYIETNPGMCDNAANIVKQVMDQRSHMFDKVKQEIETKQGFKCDLSHLNPANKQWFETTADAVMKAEIESSAQVTVIEDEFDFSLFEKMMYSSQILSKLQGHGDTLSGQISCINEQNHNTIWVTPYGKPFNIMTEKDFLLIDDNLNVLKTSNNNGGYNASSSFLKVNKATRFHFHVYKQRPDLKCLIHSHPPYASALSMSGVPLKPLHMDTMALYNDVQYLNQWPGIPFGSEEGEIISSVLGTQYHTALLANHGLIVGANTIEKATYYAYFFERAAKMQLDAMAAIGGDINKLPNVNHDVATRAKNWRIQDGPVKSHFYAWVQIIQSKNNNQH